MIYCDTSFLASLYLPADANHRAATKLARTFKAPMPLTLLGELELANALQRAAQGKVITSHELAVAISQIQRDITDGFLERKSVNQTAQYKIAVELSHRRASLLCRSLDILHVSTALHLGTKSFAPFDTRQKQLARSEGLTTLP